MRTIYLHPSVVASPAFDWAREEGMTVRPLPSIKKEDHFFVLIQGGLSIPKENSHEVLQKS